MERPGSGGLQEDAEPGQAPAAGGPDTAYRQVELIRYFGIGSRRIGHQHLEQSLPSPRQAREGIANHLSSLVREQTRIDFRLRRDGLTEIRVVMPKHDFLACRYTA